MRSSWIPPLPLTGDMPTESTVKDPRSGGFDAVLDNGIEGENNHAHGDDHQDDQTQHNFSHVCSLDSSIALP